MLRGQLIHPQILAALGRGGHGSRLLIADGNFPNATVLGPNAEPVFLNLAPGQVGVCEILRAIVTAVPVEAAVVMAVKPTEQNPRPDEPDIWREFRDTLGPTQCRGELHAVERFAFYELARGPEVCLAIASGEQRIYANLLLTIGVV